MTNARNALQASTAAIGPLSLFHFFTLSLIHFFTLSLLHGRQRPVHCSLSTVHCPLFPVHRLPVIQITFDFKPGSNPMIPEE
jgi:hypothetical protein